MKGKSEKPYFENFDPEFRTLLRAVHRFVNKHGWKVMFFTIIKYQRLMHKDTGYNFDETIKQYR